MVIHLSKVFPKHQGWAKGENKLGGGPRMDVIYGKSLIVIYA